MTANFPLPASKNLALWSWVGGIILLVLILLGFAIYLFQPTDKATERAKDTGQRLIIALPDGKIDGKLHPTEDAKLPPAELPAGEEKKPEEKPTEEKPAEENHSEATAPEEKKPDASGAEEHKPESVTTEEKPAAAGEPPVDTRSPAARMIPREHPEIAEKEIPPPTESKEAEATPAPAPTPPVIKPAAPVIANPDVTEGKPASAPAPELSERTAEGNILPVIGKDGTKPWNYYAKPFTYKGKSPLVAVIITGLGQGKYTTEAAVSLPGSFTLTFSPYAHESPTWADTARRTGHEVLVDLPLEPTDYPATDPGPRALLAHSPDDENAKRLTWILGRFTGYVGVFAPKDEKFSNNMGSFKLMLDQLNKRGLMIVAPSAKGKDDVRTALNTTGIAAVVPDVVLDGDISSASIQTKLAELEKIAKEKGYAVAICRPYPITIKHITEWSDSLATKGFVLAPVSAIVKKSSDE